MPPPVPPPPPPPAPAKTAAPSKANAAHDANSALFAEINQGEGITKRLRHVTDEEKAYKNPTKKPNPPAKNGAKGAPRAVPVKAVCPLKPTPAPTPILEMSKDKRMVARYHKGTQARQLQVTIDKVGMKDAVSIEHCEYAYFEIKEKVNTVTIMNCKRVQVSVHCVVSYIEIIKSQNVDVQVAQSAPTISIDGTSGVNLYLMDRVEARKSEIVTACSTSVNILFKSENKDEDDLVERAVPEQLVTKIITDGKGGNKIETKPNEAFGV